MSTVPPERFAAEFARLRPTERAALLADLWRARGRTVDRRGADLVLDGGTRVTLDPSTGRVEGAADEVVAPDPPAGLSAAAESAGVAVRDAADVRELLLYGLDREDAETVYRRHFGRSLYYAETERPVNGAILGRLRSSRLVAAAAVTLLALAAVLLMTGTGPAGLAPDSSAGPEASAGGPGDTPTGGAAGEPLPPGVSANGTVDVSELSAAHAARLRMTPFAMRVRYTGPENGTSYERGSVVETRLHVENTSVFRFERRTVGRTRAGQETAAELYADGERTYVRIEDERGVRYDSAAVGGASNVPLYIGESRWNLLRFLATTEANVEQRAGGGVRIRATGTPRRLEANVSGYNATAAVRPDGVVESLSVEYRDEDAGATVEFVQTVESVGTATVPEPGWYAGHPDRESADEPRVPSSGSVPVGLFLWLKTLIPVYHSAGTRWEYGRYHEADPVS